MGSYFAEELTLEYEAKRANEELIVRNNPTAAHYTLSPP